MLNFYDKLQAVMSNTKVDEAKVVTVRTGDIVSHVCLEKSVSKEIEHFYQFVACAKAISENVRKIVASENEKNDKRYKNYPREFRRQLEKESKKWNDKSTINMAKYFEDFSGLLIKSIEDSDQCLKTNEEFCKLILTNIFYNKDEFILQGRTIKRSKNVLEFFIKTAKAHNIKNDFLNCFDESGNLINIKAVYLKSILVSNYNLIYGNCKFFDEISKDEYVKSIISDEALKEAEEYNHKKALEKKLEQEKEKEFKRMAKQKDTEKNDYVYRKNRDSYRDEDELFKKIINPSTYSLRSNIDDIVSLEDLKTILNAISKISPCDKERLITEYNEITFNKRISYLLNIAPKKILTKLKNIINNKDKNLEVYSELCDILNSDDYLNYSCEQLIDAVEDILNNKLLKDSNNIKNYIIFASDNLLNDEISRINNSGALGSKSAIIKSVYSHLLGLQSCSINEIKSKKNSAFHIILVTSYNHLVVDDKLKGYRYGASKTKVCFFNLSIEKSNQEVLNKIYNTDVRANAILVFTLGNVYSEREKDIYDRAIKYSSDNKEELLHIYDIFSKPFTNETLKEACSLIDSGLLNIKNMEEFISGVNEKRLEK